MNKLAAVTTILALTSCATYFDGTTQKVSIKTNTGEPARCSLKTNSDSKEVAAPSEIEVSKSYYPVEITCLSDRSGDSGTVKVLSDVTNWGYGGAVLGFGIGAGVDTYTGAAFKYPSEIVVTMGQTTTLGKTSLNSNAKY